MLTRAARATVDHGHRYFRLIGASHSAGALAPGASLQIRMLDQMQTGEDWDAYLLLEPPKR